MSPSGFNTFLVEKGDIMILAWHTPCPGVVLTNLLLQPLNGNRQQYAPRIFTLALTRSQLTTKGTQQMKCTRLAGALFFLAGALLRLVPRRLLCSGSGMSGWFVAWRQQ